MYSGWCCRDAKVPPAPDGHKWKAIQHDNKVGTDYKIFAFLARLGGVGEGRVTLGCKNKECSKEDKKYIDSVKERGLLFIRSFSQV